MLGPDAAKDVLRWIVQGLVGFFLVQAIQFMRNTEEGLRDLSVKLAVIVEKVSSQDRTLESHEQRIHNMEVNHGSKDQRK